MASSPSKQTVTNKTELPKWIDEAGQTNLDIANQLAERPYTPYEGSLTAGASPLQGQAFDNASANAGAWGSTINNAANAASAGTNFAYNVPSFLNGNVKDYMNPYIDNVESRAIDNANIALKNNMNGIGDSALKANAFGGSRHGIAEGVAAAEGARGIGDLSAQLRSSAFDNASSMWNNDVNRQMENAYQTEQVRQNAATNAANIANTGNTMSNQNSTLLAMLGGQQRDITQAGLQEQYAKWKEEQDYPLQQLNLRLAAVGATPYGSSQTQTTTGSGGGNAGMSALGGIMGLLSFLPGLSDRDDKTDIEKLGKDPETGLTMYAYRYKGDPKTYPKIVGPMAQDIEKKDKNAVKEIGGHKVVKSMANLGFGGAAAFGG
jgi:hypothetical protein